MKLLAIETSCDETAVTVLEATGNFPDATYRVLSSELYSQIDIHRDFGGVFPSVAKREHVKIITPLLEKVLSDAGCMQKREADVNAPAAALDFLHEREAPLADALTHFYEQYELADVDAIGVTVGPGLEPALWVGINTARSLSRLYGVPVIPVNHMEGHVLGSLFEDGNTLTHPAFPVLALLISGGHTELIHMPTWGTYEKVGQTRDDAIGEAFDKVARLMGLPYPGGPEVSRLAAVARAKTLPAVAPLPRPMLDSGDLDFSFSGIKTAVRYRIEGQTLSHDEQAALAREFEDAVTEVVAKKVADAATRFNSRSLIVGGGVAANQQIVAALHTLTTQHPTLCACATPPAGLATDNSVMIALAAHAHTEHAVAPAALDTIMARNRYSISDISENRG